MSTMLLKVITPKAVVLEEEIISVTAPGADGELTILPRHARLLTLLKEGIVTIRRTKKDEDYLAIGAGYLETDGRETHILVSRAHDQAGIDAKLTEEALKKATEVVAKSKDESERIEASLTIHRSMLDLKLLKKRRRPPSSMS